MTYSTAWLMMVCPRQSSMRPAVGVSREKSASSLTLAVWLLMELCSTFLRDVSVMQVPPVMRFTRRTLEPSRTSLMTQATPALLPPLKVNWVGTHTGVKSQGGVTAKLLAASPTQLAVMAVLRSAMLVGVLPPEGASVLPTAA